MSLSGKGIDIGDETLLLAESCKDAGILGLQRRIQPGARDEA